MIFDDSRLCARSALAVVLALSALSGCADFSTDPASDDVVGRGIGVCGLVSAGMVEDVVGQQITSILFWMDGSGEKGKNDVDCAVFFSEEDGLFEEIKISYEYGDYDDIDIAQKEDNYASLKEHKTAAPFAVENIEGEGVTVDDGGRVALAWSYPNGNSASLVAIRPEPEDPIRTEERDILVALFKEIANELPRVASGPEQSPTFYPPKDPKPTPS